MGVALLGFNVAIEDKWLLERTVFPERSLVCRVGIPDIGAAQVVTFHSLTGVGYHQGKAANFAAIAEYLVAAEDLDFLCFDANEPKVDAFNFSEVEFWPRGPNASLILGPDKVHPLDDVYRKVLDNDDGTRASPLAVSHLTKGVPRRYDYIMASKKWTPRTVRYPFEESVAATSDHSLVVAEF